MFANTYSKSSVSLKGAYKSALIVALAIAAYFGIRYFYFKPSVNTGEDVPVFSATLASGSEFDLSALKGQYVLLEFWGSWCGPCIQSYPELKALYASYNDTQFASAEGFEIVSVAIEKEESRWRRALEKLQPTWPYQVLDQSSNLRFFNGEISKLYGVRHLPTKFLLGPDLQIIGTNWSISEIDAFLKESQVRQ